MSVPECLDPYAKPPTAIRNIYKAFQKLDKADLRERESLLHLTGHLSGDDGHSRRSAVATLPSELRQIFIDFIGHDLNPNNGLETPTVFEVSSVTGLFVYPSLLPPEVQITLLDKLLHRDLCSPEHQTNIHMHYHVPYPESQENRSTVSYFDSLASDLHFQPKDPKVHKPITTQQFLNKKLRWMTLGGQYDWTNKVYPSGSPPPFPTDIKRLIEDIFPMKAEAAIVNLYSPGDTLSLHRDVSEECNQPLVSISLGCDGILVVGLEGVTESGHPRVATVRLRSGDAVLMSGESRYAWHGVPKVLEATCPEWMQNWPSQTTTAFSGNAKSYEQYKGWMRGNRINLNVRQMFA